MHACRSTLEDPTSITSDFEEAEVLLALARRHRVEGRLREEMVSAMERISSDHERGRVLQAIFRAERAAR